MFNKLKEAAANALAAASKPNIESMGPVVDSALQDGILTDEEHSDLLKLAQAKGFEEIEFKFYLSKKLEEKKAESLTVIDQMIKEAIVDGEISDTEKSMILRRAERLNLDPDQIELRILKWAREWVSIAQDKAVLDSIPPLIAQANELRQKVESDRKSRLVQHQTRHKELLLEVKELKNTNVAPSEAKGWWKNLSKEMQDSARVAANVEKKPFGYSQANLVEIFRVANIQPQVEARQAEIEELLTSHREEEKEISAAENEQISSLLKQIAAIPLEIQKQKRLDKVERELTAEMKIDITVKMNIKIDLELNNDNIGNVMDFFSSGKATGVVKGIGSALSVAQDIRTNLKGKK